MKLFVNEEIKQIERQTLEEENLTNRDLIVKAAEGVAAELMARCRPGNPVTVFAGPGNNGADALAVAEMLIDQGYDPEIFLFNIRGNSINRDCKFFRDRLLADGRARLVEITDSMDHPELSSRHWVVDGLFGVGLRSNLTGGYMTLVRDINESGANVISIDVPSGLFPDWNPTTIARNVVHATVTCAIQFPHPAFYIADNADMVGRIKVVDIDLSRKAIEEMPAKFTLVEAPDVKGMVVQRPQYSSKADFGHALIIGGSNGMAGAACLAASGALRAGAGRVSVHSCRSNRIILQTVVPEAMFRSDRGEDWVTEIPVGAEYQAIAIGPGLGRSEQTANAFELFIKQCRRPLIIDADALNVIARRPHLLKLIPADSILTPHAGEFDRIFGEHHSAEDRLLKAMDAARTYNFIIILKGHYTAICTPTGQVYFNTTGNPGMATAGSGDVLTGVIAAMMANRLQPADAAIAAVYLHGLAGDLAARSLDAPIGLTASDIAKALPKAIKTLL